MTEEKIKKYLKVLNEENTTYKKEKARQGLLDLYNKQKEEIERFKNAEEYAILGKETLLDTIDKQQKEIMQLKAQKGISYFVHKQIIESDYISKDKIGDKIKELKKECDDCSFRKMLNCENQCTIGGTIRALKELLEEGEPDAK